MMKWKMHRLKIYFVLKFVKHKYLNIFFDKIDLLTYYEKFFLHSHNVKIFTIKSWINLHRKMKRTKIIKWNLFCSKFRQTYLNFFGSTFRQTKTEWIHSILQIRDIHLWPEKCPSIRLGYIELVSGPGPIDQEFSTLPV